MAQNTGQYPNWQQEVDLKSTGENPCGFKSRHVHQIRWLGGLGFLSLRGLQTLSSPVLKRVTFSRPHDVKAAVGGTTKGREARANLFVLPYGNI